MEPADEFGGELDSRWTEWAPKPLGVPYYLRVRRAPHGGFLVIEASTDQRVWQRIITAPDHDAIVLGPFQK